MSNFYDSFKSRTTARKQDRVKRRQATNLNLNSNDVLSSKAMVLILMSLAKDIFSDAQNLKKYFDENKAMANANKAEELIKMIQEARAEGKDLNLAIAESDKFKEILKEFDPEKYEENLRDIKEQIQSDKKDLKLEDILMDKSTQRQDINKNAERQGINRNTQKQRQN
ncbi:hypothetical protein [Campylobacter corcagiensis]|uniref:Uncharacterized protein n=1 Tax=Campylobacter corcagiensis TaxID=1448857 RepID=A0A6M8N3K9_9BACT|nr:hypothetical protein [Campylobacter corcagiensis]QKF65568.1 hypothetical protein CCORG_a0032 [Campylobacter corcagiensis]QOQ86524.1 hypothetical protein IMC76_00075 [Campylobacter corcagiensis]